MTTKRRPRKAALPAHNETRSHAGVTAAGGFAKQTAPEGMPFDELEYRMLLQEAILWVTHQVIQERAAEIKERATERARTLLELRG